MSHYLEQVRGERKNAPVSDIRVGTLFLGNPKCPVGELPAYSASMGEGLWVRTPRGVANFGSVVGYDGQQDMNGWVIDGYVKIDANVLEVAARFKKSSEELLFFAEQKEREIEELRGRIADLETVLL